jgi:hypothetical protein
MICYSLRLLKILPDKADHVVRAVRRDGLIAELKREIPGHIGCSILESALANDLYLIIDFWQSKYDFFESEISPSAVFLSEVVDRLAYEHSAFGPFSFPPSPDAVQRVDRGVVSNLAAPSAVEQVELVQS